MFIKQKVYPGIIIGLLCLLFASLMGCSPNATSPEYDDNPVTQRETLTQISTIDAILGGVYDGVVTFETLKGYGDFGIGTFEGLDGEMLAFDGSYYQVKADGQRRLRVLGGKQLRNGFLGHQCYCRRWARPNRCRMAERHRQQLSRRPADLSDSKRLIQLAVGDAA